MVPSIASGNVTFNKPAWLFLILSQVFGDGNRKSANLTEDAWIMRVEHAPRPHRIGAVGASSDRAAPVAAVGGHRITPPSCSAPGRSPQTNFLMRLFTFVGSSVIW